MWVLTDYSVVPFLNLSSDEYIELATYLRVSGLSALPCPLLFLPSSPATSTSAGSEMTVIWGPGGASDIAEPDLAFTRGGFRDTGGWIAALLTKDFGLR